VVARNARFIALWTTLVDFALSVVLWIEFNPNTAQFQFVERANWVNLGGFTIRYHMGIDGISLFFILLSTLLTLLSIISSWDIIQVRVREYMIAFLVLETLLVGLFCALDFVLFYVFFEGVLIPMFLIIGIWGGENRIYSAFKFFLFTLLGSVLMLLAILTVYMQTGSTDIQVALNHTYPLYLQKWLWLAFFASFAVKVPMWPVHTWLPDAHVEAPTAGSVILAGILLKMGGYGFVRFSLPLLPLASSFFTPLIFTLSAIAVIYTSLVALAQTDMKKLIAYSSIAHMGFVTMGIFAVTREAVQGAVIQMLSHGLVSGALFLCVGVLYDRLHTHEIARFGGLVERMPAYAFVFMAFSLASVGLPGTSGFVGEFLILLGTFRVSTLECALAATALFLAPAYMLYLYRRVIFGTITRADLRNILDLSPREKLVFAPLLVLVLWMGIYPTSFLRPIRASVDHIVAQAHAATDAAGMRRASLP
jgi:NADH-quinone oxidoreductase subunit M